MEKPILLFDFDGVIADTFHIGHSVAKKVCVLVTETGYRKRFDGNIHEADALARAADHGDRCDHALDWMAHYMPAFKSGARPFAGIPDLLREFSNSYTLGIVSSTHNELIEDFLETNGLLQCVADICGAETDTRKDRKFEALFAKYGIAPAGTVFVTDTLGDVNEAASVGLSSIGVTWGFQDRETLSRGRPFAIVDSPDELPAAIARYYSRAS